MNFPTVSEFDHRLAEMDPPIDPRATNLEALARFAEGDIDSALAGLTLTLDLDPGYAEAWNNRGTLLRIVGRHAEAAADFDRAVAARPNYPEALTNRARLLQERGDTEAARADLDLALEACGGSPFAASVLHNRGMLEQGGGDLARAMGDFDLALEIDPEHASTHVCRGAARKEAGDLDGALADFESALTKMPHHEADLLHRRAGVLALRGDFAAAVADYDRAVAIEPENLFYYISRGNARYHLRQPRGLLDYRMAFRIDLEGAAREFARLLVADANAGIAGVLENCDKHLRINGRDVVAHVRRGLTLVLAGAEGEGTGNLDFVRAALPEMKACLDRLLELVRGARREP